MDVAAGKTLLASDKKPVDTTVSQGKGGPGASHTSTHYVIDALFLVADHECAGIRRIWSNGKLIWTNADIMTATMHIQNRKPRSCFGTPSLAWIDDKVDTALFSSFLSRKESSVLSCS